VVLALAVGVVAAVDLVRAERHYRRGRQLLAAVDVRTDRLDDARLRSIEHDVASAEREFRAGADILDGSKALGLADLLPGVGYQRRGAVQIGRDGADASAAARSLMVAGRVFLASADDGTAAVPVDELTRLGVTVDASGRTFRRIVRGRRSLWGPLGGARVELDDKARGVAARLDDASGVVRLARSFAGGDGPRRYFVAGLNNAEMRDQGMVLSYAVLRSEGGNLSVDRSGPIAELAVDRPVATPIPDGVRAAFGSLAPDREWRSVNATADFALTGRLIADLYPAKTGEHVDGVVAVDVPALAQVLRVVGPVDVDGRRLDAGSATSFLLSGQYEGLAVNSDQAPRREQVAGLAARILDRLEASDFDRPALGRRLAASAAGGHLRLWSGVADEEATIERVGLGGGPLAGVAPALAARTFHFSVQDATATKVDYYVRPRAVVDIDLTAAGRAVVRTSITVANGAPGDARPSYAFGPTKATTRPGQYRARVYHWAPMLGRQPDSDPDAGLLVGMKPVIVDPGQEATVQFESVIPDAVVDGELTIRLVPQARQLPIPVTVRFRTNGTTKPTVREVVLDRSRVIRFEVRRIGA
jgi:hypothetical protein